MFYSQKNSIDDLGRVYLVERSLSIPECVKCGIASTNGNIYFAYRRDGRHIRTKVRSQEDKKKQRWEGETPSESMPFFNQTSVNSPNYHSEDSNLRQLIITEGEFDCVALSQLEVCKCVSLHGGASSAEKCVKDNANYLTEFDEIYIAFDMDDPGQQAAEKVRKIIDPKKYRKINFPKGSKDANEWIQNENAGAEDLRELMQNAEKITCPEIVHWDDLPDNIHDPLDVGVSTGWKNLDAVIGGIRKGEITVVTADTAAGKTTFCVAILVNIIKQKFKCWLNSYEMKTQVMYRKVASHFLKANMKYEQFTKTRIDDILKMRKQYGLYINPTQNNPDLASIARQLELCAYVYGIEYIVLDHFDYIYSTVKQPQEHERIKEAMIRLHEMALRYNVHIFLVCHARQNENPKAEITLSDIKGSSSIKQYADNIFILTRMSRSDPKDSRTKLNVAKNRLYGTEGSVYFNYQGSTDGFIETLTF